MNIKTLLWIDGLGALVAGLAVLSLREWLSELLGLPQEILLTQSIITLVYASYSTTLAKNKIYTEKMTRILIYANLAYVGFCLVLFISTFGTTTIAGKIYFLAEGIYISTLAALERKQLKYLK